MFRSSISRVSFGPGTGAILFDYVECDGTETVFSSCQSYSDPRLRCSHDNDVGLWCDDIDSSGECRVVLYATCSVVKSYLCTSEMVGVP